MHDFWCVKVNTEQRTWHYYTVINNRFDSTALPYIIHSMIGLLIDSNDSCYVSDEVSSIYKLAAVEHAILGTRNWLNLLDLSDLEILEFSSDLKVICSIP